LTLDSFGSVYITGTTRSSDFPVTAGSFDEIYNGFEDAFVTKLGLGGGANKPDLEVLPGYIVFSPPSPVGMGATVNINVMVHNVGIGNAYNVVVRFYDGAPAAGNQLDGDRVIPIIDIHLPVGGTFVSWLAVPPRFHDICVVADPDNSIDEVNETNNEACAQLEVIVPPLPDMTILRQDVLLSPAPPIVEGSIVRVNATVRNIGENASGATVARFLDGLPPSPQIDVDQSLAPMPSGGTQNVSVVWTAIPPGSHDLCAIADPENLVSELDEGNNVACVAVEVLPVTRPDYLPFQPEPPSPGNIGLSLTIPLSVVVHNQGNATTVNESTLAFYDETTPSNPFAEFKVSPLLPGSNSSRFTATWTSPATPGTYRVFADVDYLDNVTEWDETNNVYTWTIEVVKGPITSLVIGNPNYTSTATYVKSATSLDFSVLDQSGLGIRNTTYRIDGGTPVNYTATGTFFMAGESEHTVYWRSMDWAGNLEELNSRVLRVDDTPPATAISIGEPKYLNGGNFIKSSTPFTLSAVDGGVGSNSTFYRLWNGSWSQWRDYSTSFSLAGRDGTWFVEFLSFDYLGNVEIIQNNTLVLDNTPPITTISTAAPFALTAADSGCGVNVTMYRIGGGSWTVYTGGFTIAEGEHTIYYYSTDNLGNVEQERSLVVRPPIEAAVNYKPIVALIFSVILAVVGLWSSKRRPWKGKDGNKAVTKAFMLSSMPFVLAEAVTGIFSLWFEPLRIPPLVGWGTGVDSSLLVAGILLTALMAIRKVDEEEP